MTIFKRLLHYIFCTVSPIRYARWIGVKVGEGCRLIQVSYSSEPYLITLGNHVSASFVRFETHDGGVWVLRDKNPAYDLVKPIKIGNNVFLGYGTVVLPGVTIGDNVVVGASSVVSKDVPPNTVVAGVPARIIKSVDQYFSSCQVSMNETKQLNSNDKREFYLAKYRDKAI